MTLCVTRDHTSQVTEFSNLFQFFSIYTDLYCSFLPTAYSHDLRLFDVYFHVIFFRYRVSFIHSFILAISIAPLQALYYSEALPTTARILYRSFTPKRTGNCR